MSQIKEHKSYYRCGQLREHSFYKDEDLHGEARAWHENGELWLHHFFKDGGNITNQVKEVVVDILNITPEEKMIIKLKFGIDCL